MGLVIRVLFVIGLFLEQGHANELIDQNTYNRLLNNMTNYHAKFKQINIQENENSKITKGIFLSNYPSKFRYTYNYGDMKGVDIVADGENIIFYQPELSSAHRTSYENYSLGEPFMFLIQTKDLKKVPFEVFYKKINSHKETITFKVPEGEYLEKKQTVLAFKKNILERVSELIDGQEVRVIQFDNVDVKSKIPMNKFIFVPPEGVDFF